MSTSTVLLDILVVLVAAKVAAELADRVGIPAVAAEIVAGVVIGPSVLGLVETNHVLQILGELGAILLLLEVGLQMDIRELGSVGRGAVSVACVGVVLPLVGGFAVLVGFGEASKTAIFVGAALTATSVGVTARVFGDLRALASAEARTVLGAAVADDVLGLVLLTVVVRIVTEGSVSALVVLEVLGVALAFLVIGGLAGVSIAPRLFSFVQRVSRSPGTLFALALAFTLMLSELADVAKLAPIVGAFLAGLALGRSAQAERIRRDLTPLGHVFVPVFFLQVGIDVDVKSFADGHVLALAGGMLAVAVIGKVVAGWAMGRAQGDRLLVGLGMIPRGEVGLIFAGLGLREGVLNRDLYGALLLVVLATTLLTPPLLKMRWLQVRRSGLAGAAGGPMPEGGWLVVEDGAVELRAVPPVHRGLAVAFEAALLATGARPGRRLVEWIASWGDEPIRWDRDAVTSFFALLRAGDVRSWRFLSATGVLDIALPELAAALHRRRSDPLLLDPVHMMRWDLLERVRELTESTGARLEHPEWLALAALVLDVTGEDAAPIVAARQLVKRLDLGAAAEEEIALLVGESGLLRAAAARADAFEEQTVLQLATHLERPERARALYLLSIALGPLEPWERARLDELHDLLQVALARPELTGTEVRNLAERHRLEAQRLVSASLDGRSAENVVERLANAPRGYLLALDAPALARQAALVEPVPLGNGVRVALTPGADAGSWRVDVACRDRPGLLARVSGALAESGLDVTDALAATWSDGAVVESFEVRSDVPPDEAMLRDRITTALSGVQTSEPVPDAAVTFDDLGSPWYTLCEVDAPDRLGFLHAVTLAFATCGVDVHSAAITTVSGRAVDRFELTDRRGAKLDPARKDAVARTLREGVEGEPPWHRRLALRRRLAQGARFLLSTGAPR